VAVDQKLDGRMAKGHEGLNGLCLSREFLTFFSQNDVIWCIIRGCFGRETGIVIL